MHIVSGVLSFGNGIVALQQGRMEPVSNESEIDDDMANTEFRTYLLCTGQFAGIMLAAIVKGKGYSYAVAVLV